MTVRVYVPAGVPLFVTGGVPPLPPAPPPHAGNARQTRAVKATFRITAAGEQARDRNRPAISRRPSKKTHPQGINHRREGPFGGSVQPSGGGFTPDREVVLTVSVTVDGASEGSILTEEDENEQVDSSGAPLQASDTGTPNPLTGSRVSVYLAASPAWIEFSVGDAASVKSANSTDNVSVAMVESEAVVLKLDIVVDVAANRLAVETVPVTVKLSEGEVTAFRFPTVSVVDCPGEIEAGSKVQVAGAMFAQPRTIEPVNPSLVEADKVNCACPEPWSTVTELCFAVSVKEISPLPERLTV